MVLILNNFSLVLQTEMMTRAELAFSGRYRPHLHIHISLVVFLTKRWTETTVATSLPRR